MLMMIQAIVNIFIFFIGACIFSFLNVVIYRVPRKMNFTMDRSICPKCGQVLKALDLVPVLSWVCLGGRCRYCKDPISPRYPVIETLGGCLALLTYSFYPEVYGLLVFGVLALLTVVTMVDYDTMEIPNGFVICMGVFALISMFITNQPGLMERLLGMVVVSLPMLLLCLLIDGAFGGGDIKLMAMCGLFLGWKLNLLAMFLAVLTGGTYGIFVLATGRKDRKAHFAFGPFLCLGVAIAQFVGMDLIHWYFSLFR